MHCDQLVSTVQAINLVLVPAVHAPGGEHLVA